MFFWALSVRLIDLLNLRTIIATGWGSTSTREAAGAGHATGGSPALALVKLHHDGVGDTLQLLLLGFELVLF